MPSAKSERAVGVGADNEEIGRLWKRIDDWCLERGWDAELYVREDQGRNFGRVGVRITQGGGYFFSAWGDTTAQAIKRSLMDLEREGFRG